VPINELNRMSLNFQIPTFKEGFSEIKVINHP